MSNIENWEWPDGQCILYVCCTLHTGMFKKVDVLISTGGDVIFSIELPIVYSQSIHLFLNYTNDHNPTESYNRTTKIGFLNTNTVQYLEHSSFVHYDRFRVKAGLMSGQDVLGPLTTAPGAYGMIMTFSLSS